MSDDLIARLRRANDMEEGRGSGLFNEAADEIDRLTADVTQQADALRQEKKEIERLREEVRGLTAALGVTWSIGEG